MKYVPWLLTALFALILISLLSGQQDHLQHIGHIDMTRILNESPQAIYLNEQLTAKYDQLVAQLQTENDLDEEEKADIERAIYAEYLRFRQELESQFQAALDQAITKAAEAANLQLVLDEDLVRYGGKDISGEVIKRLQ